MAGAAALILEQGHVLTKSGGFPAICALLLANCVAAAPLPGNSAETPTSAVPIGVSANPCAGVPIKPTALHKATPDPYDSWMHEWLGLDRGQLCRYQHDNAGLPPASQRRVVFLGDSISAGWQSLDPRFFNNNTLDRGISGQTSAQMLVRFRADVLDLQPVLVPIMAGTNDIAGNTGATSLAAIQGNIASMVELARAHGIAVVYVDYYSALADATGNLKASLSDDGVHPNAAGYAVMRPLAERTIAADLRAHHN